MAFVSYYPVEQISYVEAPILVDDNHPVGYKWYQIHPSSDMDVMAASPCFSDYQPQFLQNTVSHPNLYYPEFKPPDPPPLSPYPYTPAFCAPYMFVDGSNRVETLVPNHSCYPDVPYNSQLNGCEDARCVTSFDRGSLVVDQNWSDAGLGSVGEGNKVVEYVVDVRREMPVDEAVVETQLFDEIPVRNSNSLAEKVSGDALDTTTQGVDKIIQTTDRILLQMEEIKHLLLAMYPPSKREVITTHKADPTPVDGDSLVIQATEVEVAPLGDNFEVRTTNPEESLLKEEVKASNLKGAVNGIADILEDAFETGSSLKKLAEIGNTKMIENFVRKTDERLGVDRLFVANYRVEIVSDMLAIDSVDSKESRDKSGKEGGVADEEEVPVPVNSAEQSFTAHTFANDWDEWYVTVGKKKLRNFDPGGGKIASPIFNQTGHHHWKAVLELRNMHLRRFNLADTSVFSGFVDEALSVLNEFKRQGMELHVVPCTSMIASCSQLGNDTEASGLFRVLQTVGVKPIVTSNSKIMSTLTSGAFIFVPIPAGSLSHDVVSGVILSPEEVYWHDLTGSVDQIKGKCPATDLVGKTHGPCSNMLKSIYPGLHDFFVNECGVQESPPFRNYFQILQQLSAVALPSQAAKIVFQVFLTCADGLKSGALSSKDIDYFKECLLHLDFTVLPTSVDRWISLHPSFGLVCWGDDEKLRKEFKHCDHIEFLYFGELSDDERERLQKMSVFMRQLGIHALSEVVTREAIYYGPAESGFKTLLINWALPFAQRYIYKSYPDRYNQLKQSGFVDICQLRIVVVEKLYYRNVIKRSDVSSKKRRECSCLLQGNVLYVTQESDSHSIFLELSRKLVDGNPELHLANFLHMITTMAESGSTEEQTEFFILNSQKVPKLPEEESAWTLPSAENDNTLMRSVTTVIDEPNSLSKRRYNVNSSWPPADWKTAPGFGSAYANGLMTKPGNTVQLRKENNDDELSRPIDSAPVISANADRTVEDESAGLLADINIDLKSLEDQPDHASNMVLPGMNVDFDSVDLVATTEDPSTGSVIPYERGQLSIGNANVEQALLTGRLGELVAYRYFSGKFGVTCVKWVNETHETGFPYDIVVGDEYIEVKATKSARKDWFNITAREWQFAAEKGECYSIARVTLHGNDMAKLTVYKNPARLCQLGQLQLAILTPRQQHSTDIVSC